jgi:hypothetical protein
MAGVVTIQVNATAQTQPLGNLTVWLSLTPQAGVSLKNFTLNVYGFINGTAPKTIGNILGENLTSETTSEYNASFPVLGDVWGPTFGNITLNYSVSVYPATLLSVTGGFYMTNVENTFLENLESQIRGLNDSYNQLNDTYNNLADKYLQLNQTFTHLQQNYTTLQNSMNELGSVKDNTTRVAAIFAITTVIFIATTVFLVLRRPKESW